MPDIKIYPGFAPSDYDKDLNIASVNDSNVPHRTKMSEVLEARGVVGSGVYEKAWIFPGPHFRLHYDTSFHISETGYMGNSYLHLQEGVCQLISMGYVDIKGDYLQLWGRNAIGGYSVSIRHASQAPYRRAIADTWAIYPSFAGNKDDLAPIEDPLVKSTQIRGYSFTQHDKRRSGFTIEDIEQNHPEALMTNAEGETTGYDPNCLLALLFESNRLLEERVSDLEAKVR